MKKRQPDLNSEIEEVTYIIAALCWKCNNEMKVAVIRGDYDRRGGTTTGPDTFNGHELSLAERHGVIIKKQYSSTEDEEYLANTCTNCNAFVGRFYLFKDYFNPAEMGHYSYERIIIN